MPQSGASKRTRLNMIVHLNVAFLPELVSFYRIATTTSRHLSASIYVKTTQFKLDWPERGTLHHPWFMWITEWQQQVDRNKRQLRVCIFTHTLNSSLPIAKTNPTWYLHNGTVTRTCTSKSRRQSQQHALDTAITQQSHHDQSICYKPKLEQDRFCRYRYRINCWDVMKNKTRDLSINKPS
jgi:hypothetical protein